jgi:NAD(P) transhydrogenase
MSSSPAAATLLQERDGAVCGFRARMGGAMTAVGVPAHDLADRSYDLVVIGAGAAGYAAAECAASISSSVALVERRTTGSTALNAGGTPTKALREVAEYLSAFGSEKIYGVLLPAPPHVMFGALSARVSSVGELLHQTALDRVLDQGVNLVHGSGRLLDDHTVLVRPVHDQEIRLRAARIIIATGSRPTHPDGVPFEDSAVYDSEDILTITHKPRNMLIIGGGATGVEYATIFSALSVPITIVDEAPGLLPGMDDEVSGRLERLLADRGIRVLLGRSVAAVQRDGDRLVTTLTGGVELPTDTLLFVGGRSVDTSELGLAAVGVECDADGLIIVDEDQRTSRPAVYAAGDVTGPTLASIARNQGQQAVYRALGLDWSAPVGDLSMRAVHGLPEVAGTGLTERDCRAAGTAYHVGRCDLSSTPRGVIAGDRYGMLKLIFHRDSTVLLGAHAVGSLASEIITTGHAMIQARATLEDVMRMVYNTPTYSEGFRVAGLDALRQFGPKALGTPRPPPEGRL